jgi:hypothetical protein
VIEQMTDEELRRHPLYSRYSISKEGQVFSHISKKWIKCCIGTGGYRYVGVYDDDKKVKTRKVSRLVLEAFVGPCPIGFHAGHLSGVNTDDRLCNLAWISPKQNAAHKKLHGTANVGERHPQAKLTWDQVKEIRRLYVRRKNTGELSRAFGVCKSTIALIGGGKTWKNI